MDKGYKTIDVATPVEGRVLVCDTYWLCKDNDPNQAIFYDGCGLGNKNKSIVKRLCPYVESKTGWSVSVVFVEYGYRPKICFQ